MESFLNKLHEWAQKAGFRQFKQRECACPHRCRTFAHAMRTFDHRRKTDRDAAIAEVTRRERTTGAMSINEAQRRARAALVKEWSDARENIRRGGPSMQRRATYRRRCASHRPRKWDSSPFRRTGRDRSRIRFGLERVIRYAAFCSWRANNANSGSPMVAMPAAVR
jgi:hypothetical protein